MEFDFTIPKDRNAYTALTADELTTLEQAAYSSVESLRQKGASAFTTTDIEALETLRTVVTTVREERANREATASKGTELLAELIAPEAEKPAEEKPAEPEEKPVEETKPEETKPEGVKEEAIVASGEQKAPRVGDVAKEAPKPVAPAQSQLQHFAHLVEGPDADGRKLTNWLDVAKIAERRLASYANAKGSGAHTIATVQREFAKELRAGDDNADAVMEYATNEANLPGGSLVAAAGWCAPSQTVYDLIELETTDGMYDVPEVQISRGGLRFTPGPDFASIFAGTGYFHYTEAQVAGLTGTNPPTTAKPTMTVPCPTFQDVRLDVDGLQITGDILQRRGYPEMVERFIRGALVAHTHKINAWVIGKVAAGSTAVDLSTGMNGDLGVTGVLAAVELAVEDIRYRHRLARNATVEAVLPHWALLPMRADFSRRTGTEMTNVTDAQIVAHFALRGARVQFVYDWQDAFSGLATGPGGAAALTALPETFQFIVYPAGTWVRGSDSVIRLDTMYDSTLLKTNQYTALFTEEGILVAKRGHDSRIYTVGLTPLGATGYPSLGAPAAVEA